MMFTHRRSNIMNNLKDIAQMANTDIALENSRFTTSDKAEAFSMMEELNGLSEVREIEGKKFKTEWRVGIRIDDKIVFDLDNHDENNMREMVKYYQNYFNDKFTVIKTLHGYHLIGSNKYEPATWEWKVAQTLIPNIPKDKVQGYLAALQRFYDEKRDTTILDAGIARKRLMEGKERFVSDLKKAGLCYPVGNFDVLHTIVALRRHRYILRISKKTADDKIEVIT
jgi:hypothetical protein